MNASSIKNINHIRKKKSLSHINASEKKNSLFALRSKFYFEKQHLPHLNFWRKRMSSSRSKCFFCSQGTLHIPYPTQAYFNIGAKGVPSESSYSAIAPNAFGGDGSCKHHLQP